MTRSFEDDIYDEVRKIVLGQIGVWHFLSALSRILRDDRYPKSAEAVAKALLTYDLERSAEVAGSSPVKVPTLGPDVKYITVTKWYVRNGDLVARDQPLVCVGTDKADFEVVAPLGGRVLILVDEGADVKVGDALCVLNPRD